MRCLNCDRDITDNFLAEWAASEAAKSDRFQCPHCNAEHVRREITALPSGERQFTYRLWGHLTTNRKKKPPKPDANGPT